MFSVNIYLAPNMFQALFYAWGDSTDQNSNLCSWEAHIVMGNTGHKTDKAIKYLRW